MAPREFFRTSAGPALGSPWTSLQIALNMRIAAKYRRPILINRVCFKIQTDNQYATAPHVSDSQYAGLKTQANRIKTVY